MKTSQKRMNKHHNLGLRYAVLIIFKYHLEITEEKLHFHFFSLNLQYRWVGKLPGSVVQTLLDTTIFPSQNHPVQHLWRIHQVQDMCINTPLVYLNCLTPKLIQRKRKTVYIVLLRYEIKHYLYITTKADIRSNSVNWWWVHCKSCKLIYLKKSRKSVTSKR